MILTLIKFAVGFVAGYLARPYIQKAVAIVTAFVAKIKAVFTGK